MYLEWECRGRDGASLGCGRAGIQVMWGALGTGLGVPCPWGMSGELGDPPEGQSDSGGYRTGERAGIPRRATWGELVVGWRRETTARASLGLGS